MCGKWKPGEDFSASALHNVKSESRRSLCKACSHPKCSAPGCITCTICRDVQCRAGESCSNEPTALNPKQLPINLAEKNVFRCEACCLMRCKVCEETKHRSAFTASALNNLKTENQRSLCKDCSHPKCSAPGCTTCKICRDVQC